MSSTDIENKKKDLNNEVQGADILGDWKSFLKQMAVLLGKLLFVISFGSIMCALASEVRASGNNKEILLDTLFPTDEKNQPYCWTGDCPNALKFPFNIPYQQTSRKHKEADCFSWVMDWYEYTLMKSFIVGRSYLKELYLKFALVEEKSYWMMFLFYVVSYLVFFLLFEINDPTIQYYINNFFIVVVFCLCFIGTIDRSDPEGYGRYKWTFFPLTFLAENGKEWLSALFQFNFISAIMRFIVCCLLITFGLGITFVNMSWIFIVACIMLLYVVYIVPLTILYHVGISKCLGIIKSYGRSIILLVTLIIIYTSFLTLNLSVSIGALIAGLFLLFKLSRDEYRFLTKKTATEV